MARNTDPILKRCKTLGISPATVGIYKSSKRNAKVAKKKQSEYGIQLNEKQKVKFIYGVLETQFRKYYEKAEKAHGITGEMLLQFLELRLDSIVYRLGFAMTRREARQLVNHGHFLVNGSKVDIASYSVRVGDVISVRPKSRTIPKFKQIMEAKSSHGVPSWMQKDKDSFEGKIVNKPVRSELDFEVNEQLIVEHYSK